VTAFPNSDGLQTSFATSPHHVPPKIFLSLNHVLIYSWIAAWSSAPPISSNKIQLATHCLPYTKLPKPTNLYIFTLKMATAVLAEMLDNIQHGLSPKAKVVHWTPVLKI
jgi:hypothetical protein